MNFQNLFAITVYRKIPNRKPVNTDNLPLKTRIQCIKFKSCTSIIFDMLLKFSTAYKLAIVCSWIIGNINYTIRESSMWAST